MGIKGDPMTRLAPPAELACVLRQLDELERGDLLALEDLANLPSRLAAIETRRKMLPEAWHRWCCKRLDVLRAEAQAAQANETRRRGTHGPGEARPQRPVLQ